MRLRAAALLLLAPLCHYAYHLFSGWDADWCQWVAVHGATALLCLMLGEMVYLAWPRGAWTYVALVGLAWMGWEEVQCAVCGWLLWGDVLPGDGRMCRDAYGPLRGGILRGYSVVHREGDRVDKASAGTIVATAAATLGAAEIQDSVVSQLAVIAVGAFGGALFGIMNAPRTELSQSIRDMLVRFLPSMFLSGPMVYAAQRWLPGDAWDTPKVMVLLAVSFAITSPGEIAGRFRPLLSIAARLRARE